jgi:hypothetical protein
LATGLGAAVLWTRRRRVSRSKPQSARIARGGRLAAIVVVALMLAARVARAEFVQYNPANGALTLNVSSGDDLDNFTVYINSTSNPTSFTSDISGSGKWGGYDISNYALEWQSNSPGSPTDALSPGTYSLATLPTGLGGAAFGNSFTGTTNNAIGAVLFGTRSGAVTSAQVTVTPEIPGTMLGLMLLGGVGYLCSRLSRWNRSRDKAPEGV